MTSLYFLLLVTQSSALILGLPNNFGGKTEFSDRGWRALIGHLSSEVIYGQAPTRSFGFAKEPTCWKQYSRCTNTYFGKRLIFEQPDSATLWVKWHQDATPFACDSPDGCSITSARSVADLSAQSAGWRVEASLNAIAETDDERPTLKGNSDAEVRFECSIAPISSRSKVSTRTLASKCLKNHMCYIQTGTLMLTVRGYCDSKPLIDCDRTYFPCEEFNFPETRMCSQWDAFTWKHCRRGVTKPDEQQCSVNVAVTGDNGEPISFQVFEQKPLPGKKSMAKRDFLPAESPFGELPDGSSGAWLAWSP